MKKLLGRYWEVIVVFLLSLTPLYWLKQGEVILGHDSGFRLEPLKYLQTLWYSWDHTSGFGVDLSGYKGFLIGQLPEALFVRLADSLGMGQSWSFVFWFFVIGISMYVCAKTFFPDKKYWIFRLLASAGYMYNLFLLQGWFITERAKFSLFAALPLVFTVCWLTLRGKYSILKGSIIFGWILFLLNGGGSPPLYGGVLVTLIVLIAADILDGIFRRQLLVRLSRIIRMIIVMAGVSGLLNAYWVVPQLYQLSHQYGSRLSSLGGLSGILAWESYVSILASFANLLRLQGIPDWYKNTLHPYAAFYNQPLLITLSFVPILCFVYVLLRHDWWREYKRSYLLLSTVISLWFVGMVLTAGSHPPAGFIYEALVKYMPGFAIFRSSFYKFGPAFWFSSIFIFSFAANVLLLKFIRNKVVYGIAGCMVLAGVLLYHSPYFVTNFFRWNSPFTTKVIVPDYVKDMFAYINTTYTDRKPRILIVPPVDTNFHADGYDWGYWGLDPLTRLNLSAPTVVNDNDSPMVLALYKAIENGDMKLFSSLAARTGITKLLWRDDVLYFDKQTNSGSFEFMKKALEGYANIGKEKQIEKWTLYTLSPEHDTPIAEVANIITQADVPAESKQNVFAAGELLSLPILFNDNFPGADVMQEIAGMTAWTVLSAPCVYCDPSQLKQIEEMKTISEVNFLPDSPIYALSRLKEERALKTFRAVPAGYIDANLGYATKHMVEISGAVARGGDSTGNLAELSFSLFQHRIEAAVSTLGELSEIENNMSRLRMISYLRFYTNYLTLLEGRDAKGLLSKRFFGNAYQYIRKQIAIVAEGVWISEGGHKRYYVTIPTDGRYTFVAPSSPLNENAFIIDGKPGSITVPMTQGIHKLETLPNDIETNAARIMATVSGDISLPYGDSYTVPIRQLSDKALYMFRLEYRVPSGENIFVEMRQNNDVPDQYGNPQSALVLQLHADGKWHVIEHVVHPNRVVTSGSITFFSADTLDDSSMVSIKDFSFTNIISSDIFALRSTSVSQAALPVLSAEEVSPAVYRLHIENSAAPFIAIFNEQYDNGWRAYVVPSGTAIRDQMGIEMLRFLGVRPVPQTNHFQINGYANAWYMSQTGSYDVVLLYWPQVFFVLSVGVTAVSLVGSAIALYTYSKKNTHE